MNLNYPIMSKITGLLMACLLSASSMYSVCIYSPVKELGLHTVALLIGAGGLFVLYISYKKRDGNPS
jgi:uncharacterized membrane protein